MKPQEDRAAPGDLPVYTHPGTMDVDENSVLEGNVCVLSWNDWMENSSAKHRTILLKSQRPSWGRPVLALEQHFSQGVHACESLRSPKSSMPFWNLDFAKEAMSFPLSIPPPPDTHCTVWLQRRMTSPATMGFLNVIMFISILTQRWPHPLPRVKVQSPSGTVWISPPWGVRESEDVTVLF